MIVRNAFVSASLQYYGNPADARSERVRRYLLGFLTSRTRRPAPATSPCCAADASPLDSA